MNVRAEFLKSINNRFYKKNQNWIAAICGGTGSGKTYSAISLVDELNPRFDISVHIVFTVEDFMSLVNSKTLKRGDIIIFEEAGVGMSAKEWHQLSNKLFNYVLQTFRHLGIGVIFTMPALKYLDNSARILLHAYFETDKIDRKREIAYLKVLYFQYNSLIDKMYKKYPTFKDENGKSVSMPRIGLRKPKEEIIKKYEEMKTAYTTKLNDEILSQLKEKQTEKRMKGVGCEVCGGNDYRFIVKEKGWRCRRCGDMTYSNPFKGAKT